MDSQPWTQGKYSGGEYRYRGNKSEGSNTWDIVTIGDSHCLMYGPALDKLAGRHGKNWASLCHNGGKRGAFGFFPEWDELRKSYLNQWQIDTIFYTYSCVWLPDTYDFAADFTMLLQHAKRLVIFWDVPAVYMPGCQTGLLSCIHNKYKRDGNLRFMNKITTSQLQFDNCVKCKSKLRDLAESSQFSNTVEFHDTTKFLMNGNSLSDFMNLVDPFSGGIIYKDSTHLNALGSFRLEQPLQRYLFRDPDCQPQDDLSRRLHETRSSTARSVGFQNF